MDQPQQLSSILAATRASGFPMASDADTGRFLRTLAAGKPDGAFLELGTGTGLATAWLLGGMTRAASLLSVDSDSECLAVARTHLAEDPRVTFVLGDGGALLERLFADGRRFDLIFADTWPGKYTHLDVTLNLLAEGGLYIVDDMLPQPNWPPGHGPKATALAAHLAERADLVTTQLHWSTGLILAAKVRRQASSHTA